MAASIGPSMPRTRRQAGFFWPVFVKVAVGHLCSSLWVQQPDPATDESMRAAMPSQMASGEFAAR